MILNYKKSAIANSKFLNLYPLFFAEGKKEKERILFENEDFKRKHYIWNVANEIL